MLYSMKPFFLFMILLFLILNLILPIFLKIISLPSRSFTSTNIPTAIPSSSHVDDHSSPKHFSITPIPSPPESLSSGEFPLILLLLKRLLYNITLHLASLAESRRPPSYLHNCHCGLVSQSFIPQSDSLEKGPASGKQVTFQTTQAVLCYLPLIKNIHLPYLLPINLNLMLRLLNILNGAMLWTQNTMLRSQIILGLSLNYLFIRNQWPTSGFLRSSFVQMVQRKGRKHVL